MRKETDYVVEADGRDQGKRFLIKEMSAWDAEWWAVRALGVAERGGMQIDDNIAALGMQAMVVLGLKEFLKGFVKGDPKEVRPLLDEMMGCVQIKPNANDSKMARTLIESDIEEVSTLFNLRLAVLSLHTGFSSPGSPSKESNTGTPGSTTIPSPIRTHQPSSARSSQVLKRP